jgi:hypothetical protein
MMYKSPFSFQFPSLFIPLSAVMDAHEMSPGYANFHSLEQYGFQPMPQYHFTPPLNLSFQTPRDHDEDSSVSSPQLQLPNAELETLSLEKKTCHLCKGKKYGFTSYFHNTKIFSEPPHDLINQVEKSYRLKDRLKSLLVTYVMREGVEDRISVIVKEIQDWATWVGILEHDVLMAARNSCIALDTGPLNEVREWRNAMVWKVQEHVSRRANMGMPKGRLAELLLEYRKKWEVVWKGYMQDLKAAQLGQDGHSYVAWV